MLIDDELVARLETGVTMINTQHKKIFDLTTDLFAHCAGDDEAENRYFGHTIENAVLLVTTHFRTEEDLMLETKFDVYEFTEHKKEHSEFIMTIAEYIKRYQETGCVDLLTFASYTKWWAIGHIKRYDKKYVQYFNQITEGKGVDRMNV